MSDNTNEFSSQPSPGPDTSTPLERFSLLYSENKPPWEIEGPQPAFVEIAGQLNGHILDVGCGSGENALYFAGLGNTVTAIDFLEPIIEIAKAKAARRNIPVDFRVHNALNLSALEVPFDFVTDCGVFHSLSDTDRMRYAEEVRAVLRPEGRFYLLCFSDREPDHGNGPRRVSAAELKDVFARHWQMESLHEARFEVRPDRLDMGFSPGGPHAWFAVLRPLI